MTPLGDPRRRNLVILGAVTALFVALAVIAQLQRASEIAPKFEPQLLFPDLRNQLSELAAVRVQSKSGQFTIQYDSSKGWVLSEGAYPADGEQVRQTAVAMAELEAVEPKTARPEWHAYMQLDSIQNGATQITLLDGANKRMADLLVGKMTESADSAGRLGLYVRKAGENQSWLAMGYLVPKISIGDWLEKRVLAVARERIKETAVTPMEGIAYTVHRENKDDADFKLADMPEGRELDYASAPDNIGAAIVGFTFDEVKPAANFNFSNADRINSTTFDGLTVSVRVIKEGDDYWATVLAAGTAPETQKEAAAINARAGGWAYKLPAYKGQVFQTTMESLLKPKNGATPATTEP
ncbi:MAG: DUF4340 domain-containing protein [Alphaproteobacteria bacterium]